MNQDFEDIKYLIATGNLKEAAEALVKAYKRGRLLYKNIALAQLRRIANLEEDTTRGVIDTANANLERAKITDILLYLTDPETAEIPRHLEGFFKRRRWGLLASIPLLLAGMILLFYLVQQYSTVAQPFDLKVFVEFEGQSELPITTGKLKLIIGDQVFPAKPINSDGQAIFTAIPGKFLHDSIKLVPIDLGYEPNGPLSIATPADSPQRNVTIKLKPLPVKTKWGGQVIDTQGQPVANAILDIENGLVLDTSDFNGYFSVEVPRTAGSKVQLKASLQGTIVLDKGYVLSETRSQSIILNLKQ